MTSNVRYARLGDASIAFRVLGAGGPFVVIVLGGAPGLLMAEHAVTRDFVNRMARFSRPVVFDVQGSGRSDPLPPGVAGSVEHQADEVIAVLTAAEIDSAFLWGTDAGGGVAVSVAAQRPDLVAGLVLANTFARVLRDADYPWGIDLPTFDRLTRERHDRSSAAFVDWIVPSVAHDPAVREAFIDFEEHRASPAQATALDAVAETLDVRSLLPQVQMPTLVMHTAEDLLIPIEHGRYLAEHIPARGSWRSPAGITSCCGSRPRSSTTSSKPSSRGSPERRRRAGPDRGVVHGYRRVDRTRSPVRRPSLA